MKIFKKIVAGLAVLAGIMFLANSASDIQLGSGMILVFLGILEF